MMVVCQNQTDILLHFRFLLIHSKYFMQYIFLEILQYRQSLFLLIVVDYFSC